MILLNGRFLTQGLTGVQRFAREVTAALDALPDAPPIRLLLPPGAEPPPLQRITAHQVGRLRGQAWEQIELPRHVRGGVLLSLGNTAPLALGARQAVVIHDAGIFDTPESYSAAFRAWYRLLHHGLARRGARIVTVSAFSRGRLAARLGLDPQLVGVMPEGGEHILRAPADAGALARFGLRPQGYALTVGSRAAHKNLDALRDAAALLAARGLTLAAVGAADPAVFRPAGGTEGPGAVALGRVSDAELRALYEHALCLVFPSRYEGFGLPPVEAMAAGCPVVAAASGAVPEVCGEAALWFDATGPRTPAAAIAQLLDTPGLAARLRETGHQRAAVFTWNKAARAILDLLAPLSPAPEARPS